ncbi:MAG TPA: pre-peptidase C-terminal domain-containing protein [Rudaea sp.]|nr:pre-peptidase C-terminal domain-containing protein [Rudaea sp.]
MNKHYGTGLRRSALVLATALAFGVAGLASAAEGGVVRVGPPANMHPNDMIMGPLSATEPMHIQVALKLRHQEDLNAYIAGLGVPGAAQAPMSPEQFIARYAPSQSQAQDVANFLSESGFTNIVIAPNRVLVSADATSAKVAAAFQTAFSAVRTASGTMGYMNSSSVHVPSNLQGSVLSVIGLQNVHGAHTTLQHADPNAMTPMAVTGHNPVEFASIYGGSGQTTGAGVTVGIITQGKITQTITDLNSFTSQNGLATVTTQTVNTNGTSTDTSGVDEWNLDSQDIVGMAGGQVGKIIFYNIPTLSNANLTADFNTVVTANAAKIINVSLGECETDAQGDGSAAAQDQTFQQAVAQGQTISVSTGDSGSDECGNGGITPSWPAASQYVIAVAGTTLNASTTTWSSETVWASSGGSASTFEPKPSWQTLYSGSTRGVADVAFDGDPNSGAKIIVNGSSTQVGGTSLSSPLFVGTWTRVIAAKGTNVGFAGPQIYQLPASTFHDVTSGSNGSSCCTASAGYDLASGRGSMIISSVLANIGGGGGTNQPPVANFSFTTNGLAASFTDNSSDSDGTIASRAWTFGDGGTSTATNPSHTYAAAGTYSVKETVTDNGGATGSKTASVTVASSGGGGGGGTVLQNGVAVTGLSAATGGQLTYTMVVPAGATGLSFAISGGTGDADLYVKFGSAPTLSSYDCRPYITGNNETCNISNVQAGTYYVMLNSYAAFSGVSLVGNYTAGGGGGGGSGCTPSGTLLCSGSTVTGLSAAKGSWSSYYTIVIPSGATSLTVSISGGTGDADLYVRKSAKPTTSSYTCRPYLTGNSETCTISSPTVGATYYIGVRAYAAYSGVTLTTTIQ